MKTAGRPVQDEIVLRKCLVAVCVRASNRSKKDGISRRLRRILTFPKSQRIHEEYPYDASASLKL